MNKLHFIMTDSVLDAIRLHDYVPLLNRLEQWEPLTTAQLASYHLICADQWRDWPDKFWQDFQRWHRSKPAGFSPSVYIYLGIGLGCSTPVLEALYHSAPCHQNRPPPEHFYKRANVVFNFVNRYFNTLNTTFNIKLNELLSRPMQEYCITVPEILEAMFLRSWALLLE